LSSHTPNDIDPRDPSVIELTTLHFRVLVQAG